MKLGIRREISTIIRKTTAVFFLVVICAPFASTHFLFKIRQRFIHNSVNELQKQAEKEDKMLVLKIPLTEENQPELFERTDEFEIRYRGKMYDLSKSEVHGDYTLYWAVWDIEETELENKFKEIKNKDAGANGLNNEEVLTRFMNTLFFSPYEPEYSMFVILLPVSTLRWQSVGVNRTDTPPTPPPKV